MPFGKSMQQLSEERRGNQNLPATGSEEERVYDESGDLMNNPPDDLVAEWMGMNAPYGRAENGRPLGWHNGKWSDEALVADLMRGVVTDFPTEEPLEFIEEGEVGDLPEWAIEQIIKQGPSAFTDATADPDGIAAQKEALGGFQEIYDQDGLTAIDRANLARTQGLENAWLQGQQQSTLAGMERRGMSGSGEELLSQMIAQQSAGMRANQAGLETAAMGQARRDKALMGILDSGSSIRDASWRETSDRATAADAIAAANAEAAQGVEERRAEVTRRGQAAKWETEEMRRARETAARRAHARGERADKYGRYKDRAQAIGATANVDLGYRGAEAKDRSNDIAEKNAGVGAANAGANWVGKIF